MLDSLRALKKGHSACFISRSSSQAGAGHAACYRERLDLQYSGIQEPILHALDFRGFANLKARKYN
jgi:hypothetical protein